MIHLFLKARKGDGKRMTAQSINCAIDATSAYDEGTAYDGSTDSTKVAILISAFDDDFDLNQRVTLTLDEAMVLMNRIASAVTSAYISNEREK